MIRHQLNRSLCLVLAVVLCAAPELATAAQNASAAQAQTQEPGGSTQSASPAAASVTPQNSPATPSAQSSATQNSQAAPSSQQSSQAADSQTPPATPAAKTTPQQKTAQEPAGAAAAQVGTTSGGAASRPAGMAIAPAKQRQVRSLLIKVGAIAAGAVAIGAVVGLSRSSPSRPPGAR